LGHQWVFVGLNITAVSLVQLFCFVPSYGCHSVVIWILHNKDLYGLHLHTGLCKR
jgi:hypothetical protein